jgi:hypothetical protein
MKPLDFDALLDEVLQDQPQAEPQPGIERRILARVGDQKARNRRRLRTLGLSGASVAACLALAFTAHHPRPPHKPAILSPAASVSSSHETNNTSQPEVALNKPSAMPSSTAPQRSPAKRATMRIHSQTETITRQMPKLDTFPAVTQQSGNLLIKSPQTVQALQELKTEQQQPIQISAIEIHPL